MSRTYKDRPYKITHREEKWDYGTVRIAYTRWSTIRECEYTSFYYAQVAGVKTKKKRSYDERNWMSTPMWWIREMMNQPQRAKGRQWEKNVLKVDVNDLDIIDYPSVSRKPHWYYW